MAPTPRAPTRRRWPTAGLPAIGTASRSSNCSIGPGRRCRKTRRKAWVERKPPSLIAYLLSKNNFPAGAADLSERGEMLGIIKYVATKPQ